MKIQIETYWLRLVICFAISISPLSAQNTGSVMPGSTLKMNDAISRADTIIIAKLISLGYTVPDALGEVDYDSAQIQLVSVLKGTANQNSTVSIDVHFSKGRIEEVAPEEGKAYLFFIHTDEAKRQLVVRILPATDDNITKVKALIATASATQ